MASSRAGSSLAAGEMSAKEVRARIESSKADARKSAAGTDQLLFEKLVQDSLVCRQAGKSELHLTKAIETVACVEMNRKAMGDDQKMLHAFALSNLGSALHILGYLDAARQLYEQAHSELASAPRPLCIFCLAEPRDEQLNYIYSRMEMAARCEMPDPSEYLDGDGQKQHWTEEDKQAALPRANEIEAESHTKKMPTLNMGSLSGVSHKSYPITSTPRKELW